MPEPSVIGMLVTVLTAVIGTLLYVVRLVYVGRLVPQSRLDEANARADRYEAMLMRALGINESMLPLVERSARVVETVEDVVGHGMISDGGSQDAPNR